MSTDSYHYIFLGQNEKKQLMSSMPLVSKTWYAEVWKV
jgi:hypothetical protein